MNLSKPFFLLIFLSSLYRSQSFGRWQNVIRTRNGRPSIFRIPSHTRNRNPTQRPTSDQIADSLGVRRGLHVPRQFFRYSWLIHGHVLPLLHVFDKARSQDVDYSLKCLWCKALSARDPRSPTFDEGLTYDMLPSGMRRILQLPNRLFPRLIHFNIELRTAYLDSALRNEIRLYGSTKKIRLITLGAGYDTRSVRYLTLGHVQEAWELDVRAVIASKDVMFNRLIGRRNRRKSSTQIPNLLVQDLNDVDEFESTLSNIMESSDKKGDWHTIFLLEGVLIYLNDGVPNAVLTACSSILEQDGLSGSLIFADLIRDLGSLDSDEASNHLRTQGWTLERPTWCVKPGLARHMGVARLEPVKSS